MRMLTAVAVLLLTRATFAQTVRAPEKRSAGTTAKSAPDGAINQILEPIRAKHSLPGLTGAILSERQVAAIGAVGVRKQGAADPFTVNDVIHLGSCTKSITATMLAQLVEERKLAWNSTLGVVLGDLADGMHPDFRQVTLAQLLTHRSGLPRNGPWGELGQTRSTTEQRRELVRRMLGIAPESKPGSKYAYSNAGYAMAGLMAETVTGQSWEDLMRERIFHPLGMASAGFGPPGTAGQVDQPWGHLREADHWKPLQSDNAPALGPAGTVHCTIGDWARYIAEHIAGYHGRSRMLNKSTFQQLQVPTEGQEYAFGWVSVARPWAHGKALTHDGSNKMWYAVVWVAPERNFAVFSATNAGGHTTAQACDEVAAGLIRHYQSRFAKKGTEDANEHGMGLLTRVSLGDLGTALRLRGRRGSGGGSARAGPVRGRGLQDPRCAHGARFELGPNRRQSGLHLVPAWRDEGARAARWAGRDHPCLPDTCGRKSVSPHRHPPDVLGRR